ncbi:MAG: DNA packaging protein [Gemmobacter sp.]
MMERSPTSLADLLGDPEPVQPGIPATMSESELATLMGIGASRVRTLARDGAIVRSARGRYDVRASLTRYLDQLRTHAARAGRPPEGGDDYKAERTRLAREQADASALKNAALRGEMVAAADVQREWAGILRDTRNALLAVPSRCGAALPHLTGHDVATITTEIGTALEGLSK